MAGEASTSERDRETVVLVDASGAEIGTAAKLAVHRPPGKLHRAFSVVLYRRDGFTLLQRRALSKYHFPGAWANACCSHPRPGEGVVSSAEARLEEELGIRCALREVGTVTYRATCQASGLVEEEFDHVLVGSCDEEPTLDADEACGYCWAEPGALLAQPAVGAAPWLAEVLAVAEADRLA